MGVMLNTNVELRLRSAREGFIKSAVLSFIGLVIELIIVVIAPSIILLTDLLHWSVDTVLEVIFLLVVYLAGRIGRKFPWSIVIIESISVTLALLVILGLYGYFFLDYLSSIVGIGKVSTSNLTPLIATVSGGVITLLMHVIQKRNYQRYKIELLKLDAQHALIDFIASILASLGIVLTYLSKNYSVELLFTFMSMIFVAHSLFEVFKDVVKTLSGANIDYELRARVKELLIDEYKNKNLEIEDVDARKIGSFYIVSVKILVDPDTTINEIHDLRRRITRSIRNSSELIYHVDVRFYPRYKTKARLKGKRKKKLGP